MSLKHIDRDQSKVEKIEPGVVYSLAALPPKVRNLSWKVFERSDNFDPDKPTPLSYKAKIKEEETFKNSHGHSCH